MEEKIKNNITIQIQDTENKEYNIQNIYNSQKKDFDTLNDYLIINNMYINFNLINRKVLLIKGFESFQFNLNSISMNFKSLINDFLKHYEEIQNYFRNYDNDYIFYSTIYEITKKYKSKNLLYDYCLQLAHIKNIKVQS